MGGGEMRIRNWSKSQIPLIIFSVICLLCTFLSASGAWFTSSKEETAELTFGTIEVTVSPALSFTPNELLPGNNNIVRNISFTNTGNQSCYLRFYCEVTVNGDPFEISTASGIQEMISYTVNKAWTKQSDDKYFYGEVSPNQTVQATVTFTVNHAFDPQYGGQNVTIRLKADSSQVAKQTHTAA